jgi:hypothetical protein
MREPSTVSSRSCQSMMGVIHKTRILLSGVGRNGDTRSSTQVDHLSHSEENRYRSRPFRRIHIKRHQVHVLSPVGALNGFRKFGISGFQSNHTNTNQQLKRASLPRKVSLFQFPRRKFRAPLASRSSRAHQNALVRNDFRNNQDSVSGWCMLHFRKDVLPLPHFRRLGLPKDRGRKKNLPIGRKSCQFQKKKLPMRATRASWIATMENLDASIRRRRSRKF